MTEESGTVKHKEPQSFTDKIIFAQKVNTAVTGGGLLVLTLAFMAQTCVIAMLHQTQMNKLDGLQVHQTTNVERPRTNEDNAYSILKKQGLVE